jgi:hypothetical protein
MIHETVKAHPVDRFCRIVFGGLLFGGLALAGCARQAVVGSPGTPGADASEATLRSEQRFNAANGRYTNQLGELEFSPSPGVEVSLVQGDRRGYSAIAATGDSAAGVGGL